MRNGKFNDFEGRGIEMKGRSRKGCLRLSCGGNKGVRGRNHIRAAGIITAMILLIAVTMPAHLFAGIKAEGGSEDRARSSKAEIVNDVELKADGENTWEVPEHNAKILKNVRKGLADSGTGTLVKRIRHGYGIAGASTYDVKSAAGTMMYGICCEHSYKGGNEGDSIAYQVLPADHALTKLMYTAKNTDMSKFWPAGGRGWGGYFDSDYGCRIASLAASYVNGDRPDNDTTASWASVDANARTDMMNLINASKNAQIKDGFRAYLTVNKSARRQNMLMMDGRSKLGLKKQTSGNSGIIKECTNAYSIAGAEYTVWDSSGEEAGKLTTDAKGDTNILDLDPGNYVIRETKAPDGFMLDVKEHKITLTSGNKVIITSDEKPLLDDVYLILEKVANGKSVFNEDTDMSGAEYEIKYYDTAADIRAMSEADRRGITRRTWVLKTVGREVGNGNKYAVLMREKCRVGGDKFFRDDDGRIVLPVGWISIKEVKPPKGFKVDRETYYQKISKDGENPVQTFYNAPEQRDEPLVPKISTSARGEATECGIGSAVEKCTIIDRVNYQELAAGEYVIKGNLMDRQSGEPIMYDGSAVTASRAFTVSEEEAGGSGAAGSIEISFTFDASELRGKTVVIFEKLYHEEKEVAAHADINDEGQSIHFPGVHTSASSERSGTNKGIPQEKEKISDTVRYSNLVPGKEYRICGKLMDKPTGDVIKDSDGKEVTTEQVFTPEEPNGIITLNFTYDSMDRSGKDVVVFEDLYHGEKKICVHADINDEGQTIRYTPPRTGEDLELKNSAFLIISMFALIGIILFRLREKRTAL